MIDQGLLPVLSAQEVAQAEIDKETIRQEAEKVTEEIETSLIKDIMEKWTAAREAKVDVELQMLKNVRQRKGEYDPDKLAEIRSVEQPEIFMNVTDTKCYNGIAWIKDIVIQPSMRIFAVDPTPIPELPAQIKDQITQGVVRQYLDLAVSQAQQTGQAIPSEMLRTYIQQQSEEIDIKVHAAIIKKAKQMAEDVADQIDDHFTEGGFYKALEQAIDDIVAVKNGFIKGPIFRREKVKQTLRDPMTGKISRTIEERIVPQYDRRSPFSIFPSPRSTGINNGYLFDVVTISPRQLHSLIGVEGFNEEEIRAVLSEYREGTLKNDWLELSLESQEGLGQDVNDDKGAKAETIYALELWDELPGKDLLEWGMTPEDIPDPDNDYPVCTWTINKHIIKAMLNYDKLGRKPYSMTGFRTDNDSFWFTPIPELIADCQQVCNACARNILANIGMGALPMYGLNVDRLEPNASRKVWPARVFPFTEEQMGSSVPPIIFYQPTMVTDQLTNVYHTFSRIADEHSGVPAWTHGDTQVGGAGNTSSGLSQLITQAARGIRSVVRNIDLDLIVPTLERHYDYLLDNFEIYGLMGDYKLSAKGTSALMAKEQQAMRKMEFVQYTQNPVDVQLLGPENRRKMLFEVAKSLGIDLDDGPAPPINVQKLLQPPVPPQPGQETLDESGTPVVGQDTRQATPSRPRLEVSTPGNPGGAGIPTRAGGGPVTGGQPYVVGEEGPEVVVPNQDGTVVPNPLLSGFTGTAVLPTGFNDPVWRKDFVERTGGFDPYPAGVMPNQGGTWTPPQQPQQSATVAPLAPILAQPTNPAGMPTGVNILPPTQEARPLTGNIAGTFTPEEIEYIRRKRLEGAV